MKDKIAEEATGIKENPKGLGTIYSCDGLKLSAKEARMDIIRGLSIEIPNAGSGSYRRVFLELLEFEDIKVIDCSSSAGDWSFGVLRDGLWAVAFQSNRYPHHGFKYSVDHVSYANSFEVLCHGA